MHLEVCMPWKDGLVILGLGAQNAIQELGQELGRYQEELIKSKSQQDCLSQIACAQA